VVRSNHEAVLGVLLRGDVDDFVAAGCELMQSPTFAVDLRLDFHIDTYVPSYEASFPNPNWLGISVGMTWTL
jgi:hypothetical protein